ncbi:MAG TPA: hypothetical protein VN851_23830 [Thermoanaerobaculia bacterium]|nr:hypothetical protein [Thermoanaerobaculia bacterium]
MSTSGAEVVGAGSILVDSGPLLLLLIGSVDPNLIPRHKRLDAYSESHFAELRRFVESFGRVLVTPNILTEVSNLAPSFKLGDDELKRRVLSRLAQLIEEVLEVVVPSREAATQPEFLRLGLTDSGILSSIEEKVTVLTADFNLYQALLGRGRTAINVFHLLRDLAPPS